MLEDSREYDSVKSRLQGVDLFEKKAVYHDDCYKKFTRAEKDKSRPNARTDNINIVMNALFAYIDENADCQFSVSELRQFLEKKAMYVPATSTLLNKLKENYKDKIIITRKSGGNILICFANRQREILERSWHDEQEKDGVEEIYQLADKFAIALRNEIRDVVSDMTYYLTPSKLSDLNSDIPKLLLYFIEKLVLNDKKKSSQASYKNKCSAICHSIMTAVRPRSFLSPLLVGLSVLYIENSVVKI